MEPKVQTSAGMETATETVNRIKAAMAKASNEGAAATGGNTNTNTMMDLLAERLSKQAEGISTSSSSQLQSSIEAAIAGTQEAGRLGSEALQIERQREVAFAQDRAGAQITGALEGRTGYATQVQALKELTETTEKSIRDLDQRYQQAILSNDAATAQRVADLQIQKLEFLQEQEQNFYSNMFSLANLQQQERAQQQQFDIANRQLTQAERQFQQQMGFDLTMFEKETARDERNQVMSLAAEYGVPVNENDTIETMINKVSPFVDEERRLRLEEIRSSISANRASVARSMKELEDGKKLDEVTLDALAISYMQGNTDLIAGSLANEEQFGQLQVRVQQYRQNTETNLKAIAESVSSQEEFVEAVKNAPSTFATEADIKRYSDLYGPTWRSAKKSERAVSRAQYIIDPETGKATPNPNYQPGFRIF